MKISKFDDDNNDDDDDEIMIWLKNNLIDIVSIKCKERKSLILWCNNHNYNNENVDDNNHMLIIMETLWIINEKCLSDFFNQSITNFSNLRSRSRSWSH